MDDRRGRVSIWSYMKTYRDFLSSLLHEKSLSPSDIESLMNRAKDSVRDIIQDKNRNPSERKQGREVLQWIQGVQRTWTREKSLHPNAINGLMRIVAGTSSSNPKGWGFRTSGWKTKGDGTVPNNYRNQ